MSHILIGSSFHSQTTAEWTASKSLTFIQDCKECREGYHDRGMFNTNQTRHTYQSRISNDCHYITLSVTLGYQNVRHFQQADSGKT